MDSSLFSPLPTPAEMNAWDQASAKDFGLGTAMLMENASREGLAVIRETFEDIRELAVLVFAGSGNNGGDAIALARHLHDGGAKVLLLLARPGRAYKGAPGFHLRLAKLCGVPVAGLVRFKPTDFPNPDLVVDGLLGTGLRGEPSPQYAAWIEALNDIGGRAYVLALDIPSGLSGETGRPAQATVLADATVTFEAAKLGLALPQAKDYAGELFVRTIGMPRVLREKLPPGHYLMTRDLRELLPVADPGLHKGQAGKLLIIGGSGGLTGAPVLAALGALRAGAGLVTVACPWGVEKVLKAGHPEVMTWPLGQGETWTPDMAQAVKARIGQFQAVVLGPGLGRDQGAQAFMEALGALPLPMVLDADALYWLAQDRAKLANLGSNLVLTPHPMEMSRLLGLTLDQVEEDRFGAARSLAGQCLATVVLKGPGTVVSAGDDPLARAYLSPFSVANLAVGGSGDVLSGVLGALLARSISPLPAACLGVYWHGLAGQIMSENFPYRGNLASEIATALPRALTEWMDADS